MPALEAADLLEDAILWRRSGTTGKGEPILLYPESVKARWVMGRRQTLDSKSQVQAYDAQVAVCCDVEVGSVMWQGHLSEVPGTADPPTPETNLMLVIGIKQARDVKGRVVRTECQLVRWNGTLPTVIDPLE